MNCEVEENMGSEQTISLIQIMSILRKYLKMIAVSAVLFLLAAACVTFFVMTPKYEATTEILVNRKLSPENQGAQLQQVQADVQMISTYKDIITSPTVLSTVNQTVRDEPGYPGSMAAIKGALSISNKANSQVFSLTATATNANTAAAIANETAEVFKARVVKIMSGNNVSIVSQAVPSDQVVSPNKTLNLLLGLLVGVLFGVMLAFIREVTDRTVTSEDLLRDELGLTSLGVVNEISQADVKKQLGQVHRSESEVLITDGRGAVEPRNHRRRV